MRAFVLLPVISFGVLANSISIDEDACACSSSANAYAKFAPCIESPLALITAPPLANIAPRSPVAATVEAFERAGELAPIWGQCTPLVFSS